MSHQSAKLYYGSLAEEMDFSLPYPAFLLEPGYSLPPGITGSSVFISPALAHGTESSWEAGVLLCAEDEQCQCCGGELIQRPGSILCSACRSQGDRSTHLQCLLWSAPVDSLGGGNSDKGPVDLPRALLPSNSSTWWPHQQRMVQPAASSEEWCSGSLL